MNYNQKLKGFRERIKDKEILKFVDFLEILYDWIDVLKEKRRITIEQENELLRYFPKKIFEELEKIEDTQENYEKLKSII